jgi:AraC family transcriptional regulator
MLARHRSPRAEAHPMDGASAEIRADAGRAPKPIRIEFDRLTIHGRLARDAADERRLRTDRVLRVLVGIGRGSVLQGSDLPPMVLIPLRGSVRVADAESARVLKRGQMFVTDAGQDLQAVGRGPALWLAILAPAPVWRELLDTVAEAPVPEPALFPALHPAQRAMRRTAVRLAREARSGTSMLDEVGAAPRFAMLLADVQSAFDPMIARCPGRTLAQRRGVFLRLQRVYNRIESTSKPSLGITTFARAANYSPCHFVRTFNAVFGETPHALLTEQRLRRAFQLVNDTELSITEVARASGFEDRCAFARSFKLRFGHTATAVRQRALADVA